MIFGYLWKTVMHQMKAFDSIVLTFQIVNWTIVKLYLVILYLMNIKCRQNSRNH